MFVHVEERHSDFTFLPSKWKNSMHLVCKVLRMVFSNLGCLTTAKQCTKTPKYILATLIFPGKWTNPMLLQGTVDISRILKMGFFYLNQH